MKILLITDEEWNDFVYANGILTNWFTGFDAEFAHIYTSPGLPINDVCDKYFQITDAQMLKSIFGGHLAGYQISKNQNPHAIECAKDNAQRHGIYKIMKSISTKCNTLVQIMRDFIWLRGRYDVNALREFISDFEPDLVFCPRYISPKLMRLESIVSSLTSSPFVAFTADDEASIPLQGSLLYRFRRVLIHNKFKKHIALYKHYVMFSHEQAEEYKAEYGIETSTIFKCGDFPERMIEKNIDYPIRMVYAGRLYCNRWISLSEIGEALKTINKDCIKIILDIYTQDKLTKEQVKVLSSERYINIKGNVNSSQLKTIYEEADIALHVESMDEYYRMITRVSFSTKIIDLMASTCAIMAICWEHHAGFQYLKDHDAAICVDSYDKILPTLQLIANNPAIVNEYAKKAYSCGKLHHNRDTIQAQLMAIFNRYIQ